MQIIITITVFLIAIIVHEVAHGYTALRMGDSTARDAGRLSFNPVRHIDIVGTVMVPMFLILSRSPIVFGWARPVPVDARNFRDPKWGMFFTSLSGPLSNFLLAAGFGILFRLNTLFFGSGILWAFAFLGVLVSLVLGFFNLIPIPPLDGSGIVASLLPAKLRRSYNRLGRYGFIIVLALLYLGVFRYAIMPMVEMFTEAIIGVRPF